MSDSRPPRKRDSTVRGRLKKPSDSQPLGFYCGKCATWTGRLGTPREVKRPDGKTVLGGDVLCSSCNTVLTGYMVKSGRG